MASPQSAISFPPIPECNLQQQLEDMVADIRRMRADERFADVIFLCDGGKEVRANRAVLAARSEYFCKLLYGGMLESCSSLVRLPAVRAESLATVFDFLYGIPPTLTACAEDMLDIYCLAEQYTIQGLCELVLHFVPAAVSTARQVGEWLILSMSRKAEAVSMLLVRVFDQKVNFANTTFEGWNMAAVDFCLEHSQMLKQRRGGAGIPDAISETLVAESVLAAAAVRSGVGIATLSRLSAFSPPTPKTKTEEEQEKEKEKEKEKEQEQAEEDEEKEKEKEKEQAEEEQEQEEEKEKDGKEEQDNEELGQLIAIFGRHIRINSISTTFMVERMEPLGIFPERWFLDGYRSKAMERLGPPADVTLLLETMFRFVSGNEMSATILTIPPSPSPSPSLSPSPSPSPSWFRCRVCCTSGTHQVARLPVPLGSGRHFWKLTIVSYCINTWVGVADTTVDTQPLSWYDKEHTGRWLYGSHGRCWHAPEDTEFPLKLQFQSAGESIVVIVDMKDRTMTVAQDMQSYMEYPWDRSYPIAFRDLSAVVFPAVSLMAPGCLEIAWLKSIDA